MLFFNLLPEAGSKMSTILCLPFGNPFMGVLSRRNQFINEYFGRCLLDLRGLIWLDKSHEELETVKRLRGAGRIELLSPSVLLFINMLLSHLSVAYKPPSNNSFVNTRN